MAWSYELPVVQDWDDQLGLLDAEGEFKYPAPKDVFPTTKAIQAAILAVYSGDDGAWENLNVYITDITCGDKTIVSIYAGSYYGEEWLETGDCEFSETEGFFPN